MKKITIIISGNIRQAAEYANEHKLAPEAWRYADSFRDIAGYSKAKIVKIGEYWKNPLNNSTELERFEK